MKMNLRRILAIFATTCVICAQTHAAEDVGSTAWWMEQCNKGKFSCAAFIDGFVAGVQASLPSGTRPFCFPKGVTKGQIGRVVIKYINDRPEKLHIPFYELVFTALASGFPCDPSGD